LAGHDRSQRVAGGGLGGALDATPCKCSAMCDKKPSYGACVREKAMKVLIAEDDRDSRELISWLLEKLGYHVVATDNGKDAWEAFRHGSFRLVISDLLMPELDGLELCRRIRAAKTQKYTYVILLTALIGKKDYLEGMDAGADDFVTKPFDPDELKARLRVAERIVALQEPAMFDGPLTRTANT
jgi:DNA-binding response OmpR family regulator